ncbi:hypothetical protein [Ferruginibacter sp.]
MRYPRLYIPIICIAVYAAGCNGEKSPPGPGYSYTIQDSKNNGVFLFGSGCNKTVFDLDDLYRCTIKEAWVEKSWTQQVMMFGKPNVLYQQDTAWQLMILLQIDTLHEQRRRPMYYFLGRQSLDELVHYRYHGSQTDTIKIPLYRQLDQEYLQDNKKAFDTLSFIKRKSD